MVTEQVEKSLQDKTPITRGSDSYERTFEIEAINKEEGIESFITDIQIEEGYAPMHYDLRWSTSTDRNTPFVGTETQNKSEAVSEKNINERRVPATVKPAHRIALCFETINGDKYHMLWTVNRCKDSLLETIICKIDTENISKNQPIKSMYKPTSDTGGELSIKFGDSKKSTKRRTYEGDPDNKFENNADLMNSIRSWINYRNKFKKGDEWVECPVINAYEDQEGEEVSLVVENPLGGISSFEFEVTSNQSSSYWTVLNNVAQGDPSNLSDSENKVFLRHRSRSFHNLSVSEHQNLIRNKEDIVGLDVDYEWEMKTDIKDSRACPKKKFLGDFTTLEDAIDFIKQIYRKNRRF